MSFAHKLTQIIHSNEVVENLGNPFEFKDAVNAALSDDTKALIYNRDLSLRTYAKILKAALSTPDADKYVNDCLKDCNYIISLEREFGRL